MKFLKTSSVLTLLQIGAISLSFILSVVFARWLGLEQYGILCTFLALSSLLQVFMGCGLPTYYMKHIGLNLKSQKSLSRLWLLGRRYFLGSSLLTLLGFGGYAFFQQSLSDDIYVTIAIYAVFQSGLLLLSAINRSLGALIRSQLTNVLNPLLTLLGMALVYALEGPLNAKVALWVYMAVTTALFLFQWVLCYKQRKSLIYDEEAPTEFPLSERKELPQFALFQFLSTFKAPIVLLLVSGFLSYEEVAIYKIAFTLASFAGFSLTIVNLMYAPHYSRLYQSEDRCALNEVLKKSAIFNTLFASAFLLGAFVLGQWLIEWVYGAEYNAVYLNLMILLIGKWIDAYCGSVGYLLSMCGLQKINLVLMVTLSIITLLGVFIIAPRYGLIGVVILMSSDNAVRNLVSLYFVRVRLKLEPTLV